MQIAIAQLNFHIGNFEGNAQKMLEAIGGARDEGADLICFSELTTCGYPPRDFLEFKNFIQLSDQVVERLKDVSHDIGIVVGAPSVNPVVEGKDLFNSAFFLYDGKILAKQNKALLPTYDIFDEYRYFEPGTTFKVVEFKGKRIAMTVCEDIWNIGNENPLYTVCPLDEMIKQSPDFIINLSASPFHYEQAKTRINVVRTNVLRYQVPLFYINHVGAQTELIFDGGSIVMSPDGKMYDELPYFEECTRIYNLEKVKSGGKDKEQTKEKMALIYEALVIGVRDYFGKLGFSKAIVGLSGGIDSALTLAIAAEALGAENVHAVLMPSQYSSTHSVQDAQALVKNLGCSHDIVPIETVYQAYETLLSPHFKDTNKDITEENIQARIRGMILMAFSNKYGYILLNTSNKSEAAVGYGTLYGDMCGGLSVIGDVYKTECFDLAKYINRDKELIPWNTITKPPSAELRPDQKDTDSLPEYSELDPILFEYIENTQGPEEIIAMGHDPSLVRRILRLVNINEFKRYQTPPMLRVSRKAFGMGRRMPIVGKYLN